MFVCPPARHSSALLVDATQAMAQAKNISETMVQRGLDFTDERVKNALAKFIVMLYYVLISDYVTAASANGPGKTIRILKFRDNIEHVTRAFWAREINRIH